MAKKTQGVREHAGLVAQIRRHDRAYYCEGIKNVTDRQYDTLMDRLVALELWDPALCSPDSPTQRVGGKPLKGLPKVTHAVPMLSIDNSFDLGGLSAFHARTAAAVDDDLRYVLDYKIDGMAVALIYEDGMLKQAVTRGDGKVGSDITAHARAMASVPHELLPPDGGTALVLDTRGRIEIRGEAFIGNEDFAAVQKERRLAGKEPHSCSRNATTGACKSKRPGDIVENRVQFVAHGIGAIAFLPPSIRESYWALMRTLQAFGIPTIQDATGPMAFESLFTAIQKKTAAMAAEDFELDYPIDGLVLKVDSFAARKTIGHSSKHVGWAVAYKWKLFEEETKVTRLETQVGKTGIITPVVYFEPVEVAGAVLQKATLHNFNYVEDMDIRMGDTIVVERAGQVIPKVRAVLTDRRKPTAPLRQPLMIPGKCPVCSAKTKVTGRRAGHIHVRCTATALKCPAQLQGLIESAGERTRLDIDGLGEKLVSGLIEKKIVKSFPDLWRLKGHRKAIEGLERMGPKRTSKLLEALEGAKSRESWRLLASLAIPHVGRTLSELFTTTCGGIDGLRETPEAELLEYEGIGTAVVTSLTKWFSLKRNQQLLEDLRELGLNLGSNDEIPSILPAGPQPLAGKKICATGKLVGYSRESIKACIKDAGGTAQSSLSKGTDYLVAGEKAGSKLAKAQSLGIAVLTEQEFTALLGETADAK